MFEKLVNLFRATRDKKVRDAINYGNIVTLNKLAIIILVIELITLSLFFFTNYNKEGFWTSVSNVTFCILVCGIVTIVTTLISKHFKKKEYVSNFLCNFIIIFFYVLLSVWGILVDRGHYALGHQMLTFYIVQFCFFCFIVMTPIIGALLITIVFILFYVVIYKIDGAITMQPQNYTIFVVAAIFANALQYCRLRDNNITNEKINSLNKVLQQQVIIDDLTGLKNRYGLRIEIEKNLKSNIIITILDIDYFKQVNDTYGHVIGDSVLKDVANAITLVFGKERVFRYGGDEILIVCKNLSIEEYNQKLENWKSEMKKLYIKGTDISINCSYGTSEGFYSSEEDFNSLVKQADDKLYQEKKSRKR